MSSAIKAYQKVGVKDDLMVADPHRIIQLLMQGALENMAKCKGAMMRKDYAEKSVYIGKATSIILALQASLDMSPPCTEISNSLWSLYDFMVAHLADASAENSESKVQEVIDTLLPIKVAWDQIAPDAREAGYRMQQDKLANAG